MTEVSLKTWEIIKKEERWDVMKAQTDYCNLVGSPCFIPDDGFCFKCGKDILSHYDVLEAGREVISGCPFCNVSLLD